MQDIATSSRLSHILALQGDSLLCDLGGKLPLGVQRRFKVEDTLCRYFSHPLVQKLKVHAAGGGPTGVVSALTRS